MEPTQTPQETDQLISGAPQKLSTPVAIIIGSIIIAGGILLSGHLSGGMPSGATTPTPTTTSTTPSTPSSASAADINNVTIDGEPFIGNPSAPALAYYSDYQCPFCKKFETTILPTIITQDVDTGKLKVVFKDFPFLGPDSTTAALFARAVWSLYPNQYFAWREAMFNAQGVENSGFDSRANIEKLTATIPGIDQVKVSAAVDANTPAYQKLIDADYAEGQRVGVQGTPSILVGQTLVAGLNPLSSYTDAIAKVVQ